MRPGDSISDRWLNKRRRSRRVPICVLIQIVRIGDRVGSRADGSNRSCRTGAPRISRRLATRLAFPEGEYRYRGSAVLRPAAPGNPGWLGVVRPAQRATLCHPTEAASTRLPSPRQNPGEATRNDGPIRPDSRYPSREMNRYRISGRQSAFNRPIAALGSSHLSKMPKLGQTGREKSDRGSIFSRAVDRRKTLMSQNCRISKTRRGAPTSHTVCGSARRSDPRPCRTYCSRSSAMLGLRELPIVAIPPSFAWPG